jgi:hypothetical protein
MANFEWIEVDDGDVINLQHVTYIYQCDRYSNRLIFDMSNDIEIWKSFSSMEEREQYFLDLKDRMAIHRGET